MKTLHNLIYLLVLVFIFFGCKKDPSVGLPNKIIYSAADTVLMKRVDVLLPIGIALSPALKKVLIDSTVEKRIILTTESVVFVTFLSEKASWENSMGFYTYKITDSTSIANKQILFPNISALGSDGGLTSGNTVQLTDANGGTKFPKGTVIGFYLVAQGWGNEHILPGLYTHYTDQKYNQGQHQQSILFVEKKTGKLILGYEDMYEPDYSGDYNNILVSISDSTDPLMKPVSFDLSKVPIL